MPTKPTLLALLIGAPPLPNATPLRTPATVTQTALQHPIASSPSALVSSPSAPLEYPLRDLRQLDSLFTSVTDTLLGRVDDLAKKLVGGVLGQTVSELRNAVNNPVSELSQVTDQVDSLNGFLSDIRSGAASTTSGGQVYDASQSILRRLARLTTEVNVITGAIQKCPTKPENLATLQETLDNLEKKLWIFVSRIAPKCDTPEEGHDLILTFQTRVTFLKVANHSYRTKPSGAARTGSGKTLSFLVPVLEILYRRKWGPSDGLGALVISPTRELAIQIFEVLPVPYLLCGARRLPQYMDQTVGFEADNLQFSTKPTGFWTWVSPVLSQPCSPTSPNPVKLPFSATQTTSVNDLARLSLKDPVHIGIGDTGSSTSSAIPPNLEHHYLSCTLDQKLSILWGFIKTHLQSKTLVFLSSCKQVRFVFETFCKMHPGVPLLQIHGKLKQTARLAMYTKFTQAAHAVLFTTDVAARGLDFPRVDWVLQVDAPEDAETYVHREEGMKAALARKGVEVQRIKAKMSKVQSSDNQLQNLCFQDPEIKYLGQRIRVPRLSNECDTSTYADALAIAYQTLRHKLS
ncbi:P-loop containing nucleoside triphosphate hydrolase protein [Mycena albidolilacea]|uniref:ATP-dependent RNA helicase n=1 Tax=Mycena albidolilacea TaxID=1033008 RepID=A0AAD7EHN6_9AGAR|nr:P-loop containing nucleoside triphosphate hydrolase protein [Mycena albidolilacea]